MRAPRLSSPWREPEEASSFAITTDALVDTDQIGSVASIPERRQAGRRRWTDKGGTPTAVAFHQNRARGTRLRGRANVEKRYLLQAAGANLALVMRSLFGLGTPRGWADRAQAVFLALPASVRALLHRWRAHLRSPLGFSLPRAAWGPPGADLTAWPAALRAGE